MTYTTEVRVRIDGQRPTTEWAEAGVVQMPWLTVKGHAIVCPVCGTFAQYADLGENIQMVDGTPYFACPNHRSEAQDIVRLDAYLRRMNTHQRNELVEVAAEIVGEA